MKKARILVPVIGALFLLLTVFPGKSSAGINLNIGIDFPLPALALQAAPAVVMIPGSYVYYAPGINVDPLFYRGYWYRPDEGHWFRCRSYNGPWVYVEPSRMPRALLELPRDYRDTAYRGRRIGCSRLTRNWERWERHRYWDGEGSDRGYGPMGGRGWMGR